MAEGHIHKLKKHKYKNGTTVFFCSLNCNFKIETGLAIGKVVLCNICLEPFTMNESTARQVRPHCSNCGKTLVRNEDGSRSYINKNMMKKIVEGMASDKVRSLRERLAAVVTIEKDEDI